MADSLDENTLTVLARLSGLELNALERASLPDQFDSILTLIDRLQEVDTRAIEPLAQAFDHCMRLREDEVTSQNQRDLFQSLAPELVDGLYLVPNVME
ncbi:MAG: Asp-tRNA(Asn)/Glu-tRNA(Gln) amidotransferase subunit GatC [Betaproteobacteria bacterium]|nr:Asp-tRNA(Asn)/Glu-tRNA(Gln) amidotransferase subunit GatC [Betaproteobacteria bacterium]